MEAMKKLCINGRMLCRGVPFGLMLVLAGCALPGYDRYPMGSGAPVRDASPPSQSPQPGP